MWRATGIYYGSSVVYHIYELYMYCNVSKFLFTILYTDDLCFCFNILVSKVVRFRFFSLTSYGNLFSSGMHFVNRRWTPSNSLISLILYGHQVCTAYSRCGLTILLYKNNIVFSIFVLDRTSYNSQHLISPFYTMCNMAGWF